MKNKAEAIQKAVNYVTTCIEEIDGFKENHIEKYTGRTKALKQSLEALELVLEIEQGKAFVARWENVKEEHANGKWLIASCEEGFHDSNIDLVYNSYFGWENGETDMCLDVKKVMTFNGKTEIPQSKEKC